MSSSKDSLETCTEIIRLEVRVDGIYAFVSASSIEVTTESGECAIGRIKDLTQLECDFAHGESKASLEKNAQYEVMLDDSEEFAEGNAEVCEAVAACKVASKFVVRPTLLLESEEGLVMMCVFECWNYLEMCGEWSVIVNTGLLSRTIINEACQRDGEVQHWWGRVQRFNIKRMIQATLNRADVKWSVRVQMLADMLNQCCTYQAANKSVEHFNFDSFFAQHPALVVAEEVVTIPQHIGRKKELTLNRVITGAIRCQNGESFKDFWIFFDNSAMRDVSLCRVAFDSKSLVGSHCLLELIAEYQNWHFKKFGCTVLESLENSVSSGNVIQTARIAVSAEPQEDAWARRVYSCRRGIQVMEQLSPTKGESQASPVRRVAEKATSIAGELWQLKLALRKVQRAMSNDESRHLVLVLSKHGVWHEGVVQKRLSKTMFSVAIGELGVGVQHRYRNMALKRLKSYVALEVMTEATLAECNAAGIVLKEDDKRRVAETFHIGSSEARNGVIAGKVNESEQDFIAQCTHLYESSSGHLRPCIFLERFDKVWYGVRFWCSESKVQQVKLRQFSEQAMDTMVYVFSDSDASEDEFSESEIAAKVMTNASSLLPGLRWLSKLFIQIHTVPWMQSLVAEWCSASKLWLLGLKAGCFESEAQVLTVQKISASIKDVTAKKLFCCGRMTMTSKVTVKQRYIFRNAANEAFYCTALRVPLILKEAVTQYERWHMINVGYDSSAWLSRRAASVMRNGDSSSGEDSFVDDGDANDLSDEDADGNKGDKDVTFSTSGASSKEPEAMIAQAWDILRREGVGSLNKYRHPLHWSVEVLRQVVAKGALSSDVPLVSSKILELVGLPLVVYVTKLTAAELVNMPEADRKFAYFALNTRVIGEAQSGCLEDSIQVEQVCLEMMGQRSFSVPLSACCDSVESLDHVLTKNVEISMAAVRVRDSGMAKACHGKNFKMETEEVWKNSRAQVNLGLKATDALNAQDTHFKEFLSSFNTSLDSTGAPRDLLSEALMKDHSHSSSSMFAEESDYPDVRPVLSEVQLSQGKQRCPIVSCNGIITRHAVDCPKCACWPKDACQCRNCRTKFDPNERNSCAFCSTVFPHAGGKYEQQQMLVALTAAVKGGNGGVSESTNEGGFKAKDRKTVQIKEDDAVVTRIVSDDRGAPEVRIRHVRSSAMFLHALCKIVSTAAEDTLRQRPPLLNLTCAVNFDMLSSISKGLYGKPGKGLSVWQCLPNDDVAWDTKQYFKLGRDKEKPFSAEQYGKMRYEIQMHLAIRGILNLVIIMKNWANSAWGRAVEMSAEVFKSYYDSLEAKLRASTFTPAVCLDLIDGNNELCSDYLRELVSLDKTNDSTTSHILLSDRFPDLDINVSSLEVMPYLTVRVFCEKHNGSLSASCWPEEEFDCGCRWHRTIRRKLKEFQAAPTSLGKVRPEVGKPVGGSGKESGGANDAFKTQMGHKTAYPIYNGGRGQSAKNYNRTEKSQALEDFFDLIREVIPDDVVRGKKLCIGSLGFGTSKVRGCQERAACTYYHKADVIGLITEEHLASYPRVQAYLIAKCNGTKWQQNVLTGSKKNQMKELEAMVKELLAEVNDEDDGAAAASAAVVLPAPISIASRTRSRGAVGAVAMPLVQSGFPLEITVLGVPASGDKQVDRSYDPAITVIDAQTKQKLTLSNDLRDFACNCGTNGGTPCDPKGSDFEFQRCGFQCSRAFETAIQFGTPCSGGDSLCYVVNNTTAENAAEHGANVAELSRVCFSPKPGRDEPTLLGSDVGVEWKKIASTVKQLGDVPVLSSELLIIECKAVAHAKPIIMVLEVCECGEEFNGMLRQCETITSAATGRTNVASVFEGRRKDAKKWKSHRTGSMANAAWMSEYIEEGGAPSSRAVRRLEANVVASSLQDSQPILPHQSAVLMQPSAEGSVEVKIFIDKFNQVSMQTGYPLNVIDLSEASGISDVPVVFKIYYKNHARPAILKHIVTDGMKVGYTEDPASLRGVWEGMTSHQWRGFQFILQHSLSVSSFAMLTVAQTLSGDKLPFPDFVTQLNCSERFGVVGSVADAALDFDWSMVLMEPFGNSSQSKTENEPMDLSNGMPVSTSELLVFASSVPVGASGLDGERHQSWSSLCSQLSQKVREAKLMVQTKLLKRLKQASTSQSLQWKHFNTMFGAAQCDDVVLEVPEDFDWRSVPQVVLAEEGVLEPEECRLLMTRAARALHLHMEKARVGRQGAKAPDEAWMTHYGELMAEVVRWSAAALPEVASVDMPGCIESMLRRIENPFQTTANMNASVVDEFFSDLPAELKKSLKRTMSEGVDVGLPPMPEGKTNSCKASHTASENGEAVNQELRKFTANGHVRAYPAQTRQVLQSFGIRVSRCHFVKGTETVKARLIADLSSGLTDAPDESVNALSPEQDWEGVQCDYIDQVVEVLAQYIAQESGLDSFQLIAIKADLKSAFLQIPLSLNSIGSVAIEFGGWIYVFGRTPFGWKWATHTWSEFSRAIKMKVNNFEREGWSGTKGEWRSTTGKWKHDESWGRMARRQMLLTRLETDKQTEALALWKSFLAFFYVDDNYSLTQKLKHKPDMLADVLRMAGFLLLGYSCWSFEKAKDDGFFALVHTYTGIMIDVSKAPKVIVSFSQHRCEKIIDLLKTLKVNQEEYTLGWVQSTWGNLVWFFKVYVVLRAFSAALRRMLSGVATATARASFIVKPHPSSKTESQALANKKCYRDLAVTLHCVEHLLACKVKHGEMHHTTSMPIECMREPKMRSVTNHNVKASYGGDASKVAWSCLNHVTREYMLIPMPLVLQHAISRVSTLEEDDPRRRFFIGVAEHIIMLYGMAQWGMEWHLEEIFEVLYHTDSQNSYRWTLNGFANNELAQDFARLGQAMQMVLVIRLCPVWWATTIIWFADTLSRSLREDGSQISSVREEFEVENRKLSTPYKQVEPKPAVLWLRDRIQEARHAFHCLSEIHLAAEQMLFKQLVAGVQAETKESMSQLRNAFTTEDMIAHFISKVPSWSFAHIGSAGLVDSHGIAKTKLLLPKFGCEIDPPRKRMWQDGTHTRCLGDIFDTEAAALPWVMVLIITLPCENYSSSGNWRGSLGETGWMWVAVFKWVMIMQPGIFFSEQADNAVNVNNGADLATILAMVEPDYVVQVFVIKVAEYGSCTHRKRLLLVGLRRDMPGAHDFVAPKATFGTWRRITLDEILDADSLVPEQDWYTQPLKTMYPYKIPAFGEMQRIGRLGPGMGHSKNPHLNLGRKGVANGPTGHGGGGTVTEENYVPETPVLRRRKFTLSEYHSLQTAPDSLLPWHQRYSSDPDYLRQCVNQGFPSLVMFEWMQALCEHLEQHGIVKDMPAGTSMWEPERAPHMKYVATDKWYGGDTGSYGSGAAMAEVNLISQPATKPSSTECNEWLKELKHDWTQPLYPLTAGRRPDLTHLSSLTHAEWTQMHYTGVMCQRWGLEKNSVVAYELGQRHFAQFMKRYPVEKMLSAAHRGTDNLFCAPWTPSQTEAVLYDFVLHEVGVRGNGWSSCRTKLYGIRHRNVFHGCGDVLKGKSRLWQLLGAVKKIRGPAAPKHMVTMAMLGVIRQMLDLSSDHGVMTWAAVLIAFHFMMRSAEYLAKLEGGAFDIDRVVRIMDITFYCGGIVTDAYDTADEVRVTFGKSKMTRGGEVRAMLRCESEYCVVQGLATMFKQLTFTDRTRPLFAWLPHMLVASKGQGLRYCDMMCLLKRAAEICGYAASDYGTHSLRRGGAGAYLAAGGTLEQVTFHGRWAPGSKAAVGYVAPGAVSLLSGFQSAVCTGKSDARVLLSQPPRPRVMRDFEMAQALAKHLQGK